MGISKLQSQANILSGTPTITTGSVADSTVAGGYKTAINITGAGTCTGLFIVADISSGSSNYYKTIPCRITIDGVVKTVFNVEKASGQNKTINTVPCLFSFTSNFKVELSPTAAFDGDATYYTLTTATTASIILR